MSFPSRASARPRSRARWFGSNPVNGSAATLAQGLPSATTKCAIHDMAKERLVTHLSAMGLHVEVMKPHDRFDVLINGTLRVAIRVALPSVHPVRVQVGKRQYQYQYRSWLFNFHHHARIDRYADFLICLPVDGDRGLDPSDVYVIPWEVRSGKTFSLHEARRPYRGRYTRYRGAWEQLRGGRGMPVPSAPERVPRMVRPRVAVAAPGMAGAAVVSSA